MERKLSRRGRYGILAAIMAGVFGFVSPLQAMPTGGTSDTATIASSGNTMNIDSAVADRWPMQSMKQKISRKRINK